eukprot:86926_1
MPVRLSIGDAVLVYLSDDHEKTNENIQIGVIKYIGFIHGFGMNEFVGIDLVENTDSGHEGTINGVQYFQTAPGHAIHTRIANVIRKLSASEVSKKMQEIIKLFKGRLDEYAQALSQRDEYIEELKNMQRSLKRLLREHGAEGDLEALNSAHGPTTKGANMRMISRDSPSFSFLPNDNKFPSAIKPHQMSSVASEDTMSMGSCVTDLTLLDQRRKDSALITLNTINENNFDLITPDTMGDTSPPITPYNAYSPRSDSEVILHSNIGSMNTAAASPGPGQKSALSNGPKLTSQALGLKTRYGSRKDDDNFPDTDEIANHHRRRGRDRVKPRNNNKNRHRVSSSVGSISTTRLSQYTQDTNYTQSYISRSSGRRKKKTSKKRRKKKARKKKPSKSRHRTRRKKHRRKDTEVSDSYSSSDMSSQSGSEYSESSDSDDDYHDASPPSHRNYVQAKNIHKQHSNPVQHNRQYILGHTQHTSHPSQNMNRKPMPPGPIQRPLPILPNNRMQVNGGLLTPNTPTSPMGHVQRQASLPNSPLQSWTQHVSAVLDSPVGNGVTRQRHNRHGARGASNPGHETSLSRAQSQEPHPKQHYYQQQQQRQPQQQRPPQFMKPVPELRQKPKPKVRIVKRKSVKGQTQSKDGDHRRSVSWNPRQKNDNEATHMQQNNHIMRGHEAHRTHNTHNAQHGGHMRQTALQKPARQTHAVQYSYDQNPNVYYPQPQIDDWMQQQMHAQHPSRPQHYL